VHEAIGGDLHYLIQDAENKKHSRNKLLKPIGRLFLFSETTHQPV
jgi:hypothetical protein